MKIHKEDINIKHEYAEITVKSKGKTHLVLIDIEDVNLIIGKSVFIYTSGYCYIYADAMCQVIHNVKSKYIALHSLILKHNPVLDKRVGDHINRNKLDNRRSNIRLVSRTVNGLNRNTKGYSYDKSSNLWKVDIPFNGKRITKRFKTENEAIEGRNKLLQLYYPKLNNIITND